MEGLKIKVNNEAESKEVQELFFELGYRDRKNWTKRNPTHRSIQAWRDGEFTFSLNHNQVPVGFKEITLQELRDMVVLKRNDINDATHKPSIGYPQYHCSYGGVFQFFENKWNFSHNQLPPIKEDMMKESLNDKIATAEVARQEEKHSHYKKDVSHLNVIDPYRIADLYDLHPCADHIMKKSLCAGNRGHKDTLRDIQDIIDTAERWKQMIEEDNSEI